MTRSRAPTSLRETINQGRFYDLPVADLLQQIQHSFEWELDRLKDAYSMQEPGSPVMANGQNWNSTKYPSELLYHGKKYDEIDRTLVGILALRWIMNNDYNTFVSGQPDPVKLTRESFDWLRDFFKQGLRTPDDLFTLVTAMIINDLGKDPNLEKDYFERTGESVVGMNHDMVLYEAAQVGMVRSLDRLEESYRQDVLLGLKLGSELNAGQLAQAENVIGSLQNLLDMRGHERAFNLKYMEQLLDVAGAAGHSDPRCAKKMIEPVFQGFKTVHKVALDIISGNCDLRQGYDAVLDGRGEMLRQKGFRKLSVYDRDERALLRLLTMGRTADKEQADLFYNTFFHKLPASIRLELVDGLNVDGYKDGIAIVPYYMPAMLSEGLENTKNLSEERKQNALGSLMRFLARVLEGTKSQSGQPGVAIEKNLMNFQRLIGSEEFRNDPKVLDDVQIPKGEVLRRRRTSNASATTFRDGSTRQAEKAGPVRRQDSFPIREES